MNVFAFTRLSHEVIRAGKRGKKGCVLLYVCVYVCMCVCCVLWRKESDQKKKRKGAISREKGQENLSVLTKGERVCACARARARVCVCVCV